MSEKTSRRGFVKYAAGAIVAAAAIGGGSYYLLSGGTRPSKDTVKLGLMMALTGPYSGNCGKMLDGAKLAVKQINDAGGILGNRMIDAVVRDDDFNPGVAVRRATELIETAKVEAIIGTLGTHIVHALNDYMKKVGKHYYGSCIPVVATKEAAVRSPYTYFMLPSTAMISKACGKFMAEKEKKWYIIFPDYSGGHEMNKYMTEMLLAGGAEILGNDAAPLGATDFSPFLTRAKAAKPDGLCIGGQLGTDLQNILKQAAGFGLQEEMMIFSMNNTLTDTMAIGLDLMSGVYSFLDFYWKLDFPGTKEYTDSYAKEYGEVPDTYSIGIYEAVHEWAAAVDRAGTLDSDAVKAEIDGHHYSRVKGDEYFRNCDGQVMQDAYFVQIKDPSDVNMEDFPEKYEVFDIIGKKGGEEIAISCGELGY
jgi:branched-chain amino acid transport system substrate-binding protein